MKNSDAKIKANNRYTEKTYDRLSIYIPKGQKEIIKSYRITSYNVCYTKLLR